MLNNAIIKNDPNFELIQMEKIYLNQLLEGNTLMTLTLLTTFISQAILTLEFIKSGTKFQIMIIVVEWVLWLIILLFLLASAYYQKPYYVIYSVNLMVVRLLLPLLDFENKKASTDQAGMGLLATYQIFSVMIL